MNYKRNKCCAIYEIYYFNLTLLIKYVIHSNNVTFR